MTNMLEAIRNEDNVAYTENGAQVYRSTGSKVLDYFSLGGALRNTPKNEVIRLFSKAWAENPLYAMRVMYYFRDVRGGQGQRQAFRDQIKYMATIAPDALVKNLRFIPEMGRWDDLYALVDTDLEDEVFAMMAEQFNQDVASLEMGESVSLLAKWLKSENASSEETKRLARKTREALGLSPRSYRKALSKLRKAIDIVERKVSSNKWDDINYEHVPSNAMMKYRKAFYKHDNERYESFIHKVDKGEAKVNAATLYPYEIIEKVMPATGFTWSKEPLSSTEAMALNNQWNALPDYIAGAEENSIAVVDTSGSMNGTPINVAVSLGIYMAERAKGPYKDHFITFSANPKLQEIQGKTILEKTKNLVKANWTMNTNLEAVFNLILKAAVNNKIAQEDMIKKLYIISDMQFDRSISYPNESFFSGIRKKFANAGYEAPLLVFWNVDARANMKVPMKMDERGFVNVSGFSPSIFKSLMDGEILDSYSMMEKVINDERYREISV